jgi:hypothetical protein
MKGDHMIGLLLPLLFIVLIVLSIWFAVDTTDGGGKDVSGIVWRDLTDDLLEEHRGDSRTR